ncbi:thioredoxin family protein [Bacillus mycoides]|uniref:Thioredoxin n=1 Tax=Bacillus mycoides TaxID=1405 RepID=A0AAP8KV27_BACMY|nr:thioredoxin domain-containing protein [Bacillus mycoides]PJN52681.1 hypothetical protein BAWEI_57450 [Bacillus mycoides]PJN70578.1 hypothetical protein BACWE_25060 [Bacillus mycoides]
MPVYRVTDMNFNESVFRGTTPVLVEFTAGWCKPCKELASIIEKISDDKKEEAEFYIADVDECYAIAAKYRITALPTVIVFKDGQQISKHEGLATREKLLELLGV